MNFEEGLDEGQLTALRHDCAAAGSLALSSGPGTGKTTVLTRRAARLLHSGLSPENLLCLTLNARQAAEIHSRISDLLCRTHYGRSHRELTNYLGDPEAEPAWREAARWVDGFARRIEIQTYHGLARKILRVGPDGTAPITRIGIPPDFTLDNAEVMRALARQILEEFPPSGGYALSALIEDADRARSRLSYPPAYHGEREAILVRLLEAWRGGYISKGVMEFADLIGLAVEILDGFPDICAWWRGRYKHILIDEFQDTTPAQIRLLRAIMDSRTALVVGGDPDQTVQRSRGSDPAFLEKFTDTFPGGRVLSLDTNYRFTADIAKVAGSYAIRKIPVSVSGGGSKISIYSRRLLTSEDETTFIVREASRLLETREVASPSDIVVLVRSRETAEIFATEFERRGMPYDFEGFSDFWVLPEVKAARAALVVAGVATGMNPPPEARAAAEEILSAEQKDAIAESARGISLSAQLSESVNLILTAAGFPPESVAEDSQRFHLLRRVDYLRVLAERFSKTDNGRAPWPGVLGFLDTYFEQRDMEDSSGESRAAARLSIATVHTAKGREWDTVFIPALEEGIFPTAHWGFAQLGEKQREFILDEEQRLFFVAMTRARRRLIMTHVYRRRRRGEDVYLSPSRFLRRLSAKEPIELTDDLMALSPRERWKFRGRRFKQWLLVDGDE